MIESQIRDTVRAFASFQRATGRWEIYWAAGIGTMSSPESALAPETRALSILLGAIQEESLLTCSPGKLAIASSAGAIYAGSTDAVINEDTPAAPTTAYAREKLRQEELIAAFIESSPETTGLIARISTLYGAGQSPGKQQGLLTNVARSMLRNQPIRIYVPLDTIRDYIAADDAARKIVAAIRLPHEHRLLLKIVASERPTTVAEIVATFKKISRRAPRIITGTTPLSTVYPRCVRFHSKIASSPSESPKTNLLAGVAQVIAAERANLLRGSRRDAQKPT